MKKTSISKMLGQVPRILIVDDEKNITGILEEFMYHYKFSPKSLNSPLDVNEEIRGEFYNVVLLDINMPGKSGIELIREIRIMSPDTKVIIMTGYAEKETVIQALRYGAFDFIEKPFTKDFIYHTVKRAIDTQRTGLEFKQAYEELKEKREELVLNENRFKQVNKQLLDTNNALSVLAQNIDRTRKETESQVAEKIKTSIIPILDKIGSDEKYEELRSDLELLMEVIDDLMTTLSEDPQINDILSATEFRVAALIKNGLSNEEIADHMFISTYTVKSHRRRIRKKLALANSNKNLQEYLRSKFKKQGLDGKKDVI
ncbi:MAG: response regulator [Nitrospirota bacterium]